MGAIVTIVVSGLLIGGLGRLAVPGPDPMPLWLTIGIGVAGSFLGGGIAAGAAGPDNIGAIVFGSVLVATALVIGYRRFFQGRGVTGPSARRRPTRGFGIRRRRGEPLE